MSVGISVTSLIVHVIMITFIGIVVPFEGCPTTWCGCDGAHIAVFLLMIQVILFLRMSSSSGEASALKSPSWDSSSLLEASSSSIEVAVEVVEVAEIYSSSVIAVEVSSASPAVLWVVWAILPHVSPIVCSTRLIAFLFQSFLSGVLKLLGFRLGPFLVTVFSVGHFLLLLHEVFDLLF